MPDLDSLGQDLLEAARELGAWVAEAARHSRDGTPLDGSRVRDISSGAERHRARLATAGAAARALAEELFGAEPDPRAIARGVAAARMAIELEPAIRALADLVHLARERTGGDALTARLFAIHLAVSYRQCVAALQLLAELGASAAAGRH